MSRLDTLGQMCAEAACDLAEITCALAHLDAGGERELMLATDTLGDLAKRVRVRATVDELHGEHV